MLVDIHNSRTKPYLVWPTTSQLHEQLHDSIEGHLLMRLQLSLMLHFVALKILLHKLIALDFLTILLHVLGVL